MNRSTLVRTGNPPYDVFRSTDPPVEIIDCGFVGIGVWPFLHLLDSLETNLAKVQPNRGILGLRVTAEVRPTAVANNVVTLDLEEDG